MNTEFYKFLYHLRASGFVHNTRENSRMIFYRNSQPIEKQTAFTFRADSYGDIAGNHMCGEMNHLSMQSNINFRNTIIGVAFALNMHALDKYVDLETAAALSDFYIQKAENISTPEEFSQTMTEMCAAFHELSHKSAWKAYGQPIDSCIDFVFHNLYSRFTVRDIACHVGYEESYLSTLFKKRTGQTLYSFIQSAKIQESRVLLLYTSQPLTSIASALGYHSLSHFSKAFKKAEGISPLSYRKKGLEQVPTHFYGNSFLTKSSSEIL